MPDIFLADGAAASSVDRGHSLRSLLPPPAALPSLPTGYNTDTLSGFTATEDRNGNLYRCIVTDGAGNTVTSNEVKLNTTDFAIYRQPSNAWGILGDEVSFSVQTYSTTSVTYQWQYSYDGGENWHNSTASGNTTNTLSGLKINDARLGYRYRCVVTDGNGTTITSSVARMRLKTDTWRHTYDANGMRTQRTDGNTTYKYIYNGGSLRRMTVGDEALTFGYDTSGKPMYVQWSGDRYFYLTNIQGDVVGLLDSSGNVVVTYAYDAWGNILSIGGDFANTLGKLNPLRYRGYVYDVETGLYYLQSRYYNPEMGRFVNADCVVSGVGGDLRGYNPFVYCFNNPVNMSDTTGNWADWIKNTVKWVAKNIVKPVVKTVQKTLSKVDLTYSTGVNVSGTPSAWIFNDQIGVSMDTKGNVAIQASGGGGITGGNPGISITRYHSITNAPNIDKLNDMYYQVGGSMSVNVEGIPGVVGGDVMYMPDPELNTGYYGLTANMGLGTPGKEFHVEWGGTVTLPETRFNIYDIARSAYIKIMEW